MSIIKLFIYMHIILNLSKKKPREKNLPDPFYITEKLNRLTLKTNKKKM